MGIEIDRSTFSDEEYVHAGVRLRENLAALTALLDRPGFGSGDWSLGAELELSVVDGDAEALAINTDVLADSDDPRLQLELDRFNLEYNLSPVPARGRPFTAMRTELESGLDALAELTARHGGRLVPVGILPTLRMEHLQADWMTDKQRYHALAAGIRRMRGDSIHIQIDGDEPLKADFDTCTVEGANTSFQVHLRVDPGRFADCYNAAQLSTPLAIAVSANSPFLLGHSLWDETRIALFKQAVDTRRHQHLWRRMARVPFGHGWVRHGALELFAESCHLYPVLIPVTTTNDDASVVRDGGIPQLAELRLHQGTIWNWNRPVYDPAGAGHLRIELRSLPSGPTPIDLMAGAAFHVGLTVGLSHSMSDLLPAFPFRYADYNFYRAAQHSLDATLLWPDVSHTSPRESSAASLCRELLPVADEGLDEIGVEASERQLLLGLIRERIDRRLTPAAWQRRVVRDQGDVPREQSLRALVEAYLEKVATRKPVTEW